MLSETRFITIIEQRTEERGFQNGMHVHVSKFKGFGLAYKFVYFNLISV